MVERIQDLNLPNSNITKIIKDSLPADVNMDKGNLYYILINVIFRFVFEKSDYYYLLI